MPNQYYVPPPDVGNVLQSLMQGYDTVRNIRRENRSDAANEAAARAMQSGDTKAALAALMGIGNFQGAAVVNNMENQSPQGITRAETARQEVQAKYAPKTTNIKTASGEEVTVEKGPNGYRVVPVQGMTPQAGGVPIPPGVDPKMFRQEQAKKLADLAVNQPQAEARVTDAHANLDRLKAEALSLKSDPSLSRITGITGAFPSIPGSGAANAEARLETLKSQVGFGVLQAMREASKTGGALGNVSNAEGQRLEANLAALNTKQSPEQFRKSLQQIIEYVDGAKGRIKTAYDNTYSGLKAAPRPQQFATAPDAANAALRADPNLRAQYEAKYGPGSAAMVLGQ